MRPLPYHYITVSWSLTVTRNGVSSSWDLQPTPDMPLTHKRLVEAFENSSHAMLPAVEPGTGQPTRFSADWDVPPPKVAVLAALYAAGTPVSIGGGAGSSLVIRFRPITWEAADGEGTAELEAFVSCYVPDYRPRYEEEAQEYRGVDIATQLHQLIASMIDPPITRIPAFPGITMSDMARPSRPRPMPISD